ATGLQRWVHPPFLAHAGGGSLGVRRTLHERVGGFDESFVGVHDTDYCWRLQLEGAEIHFVPDAVVHVRFRGDARGIVQQARSYGRGAVALYARYRDRGMPALHINDGVAGWGKLLLRTPRLLRPAARHRWLWKL